MRMRSVLVRKKDRTARAEVLVFSIDGLLIVRREVIANHQFVILQRQFQDGVAIGMAIDRIEHSISGDHKYVAVFIGSRPGIALPYSTLFGAGRSVECGLLPQCLRVISHYPAVIIASVAGRAP